MKLYFRIVVQNVDHWVSNMSSCLKEIVFLIASKKKIRNCLGILISLKSFEAFFQLLIKKTFPTNFNIQYFENEVFFGDTFIKQKILVFIFPTIPKSLSL